MSRTVRFGLYDFDTGSGILSRAGAPVPLEEKPVQVLSHLVERAPDFVPTEVLLENHWGGSSEEAEQQLRFAIRQIRRALGDSSEDSIYVRGGAREGYRLAVPVYASEARSVAATAKKAQNRIALAVGLGALAGLAYIVIVVLS
ncbi:MAG: transcriptional regulator [Gemmatimonadales bacterium]